MGTGNSREAEASTPDDRRGTLRLLQSTVTVVPMEKERPAPVQQQQPGPRDMPNRSMASMSSLNLPPPEQIPNEFWMERLRNVIGSRPLTQIVLPGTRHSGSYSIDEKSEVGPGAPTLLQAIQPQHTPGGAVAAAWARTQTTDIATQLDDGIRYLDLRVAFHSPADAALDHLFDDMDDVLGAETPDHVADGHEFEGLFVSHHMLGARIEIVLGQIRRWLDDHPKEIVVVDFQKFENFDDTTHATLVTVITDSLASKMAPSSLPAAELTYDSLVDRGCHVIVLYNDDHPTVRDHPLLWPRSKWLACPEIVTTKMDKLEAYCSEQLAKRPADRFFALEAALTPMAKTLIEGLIPDQDWRSVKSSEQLASKVTPHVISWLSGLAKRLGGLNVVMVDHYRERSGCTLGFVDTVKRCNLLFPFYATQHGGSRAEF